MSVKFEDLYTPADVADPDYDDIPNPCGWRLIVRPVPPSDYIEFNGGMKLYKPDSYKDEQAIKQVVCKVLKIGPAAWSRSDMGDEPWAKEGDYVIAGKYAGLKMKVNGVNVRCLNDDEVIAVVTNLDAVSL